MIDSILQRDFNVVLASILLISRYARGFLANVAVLMGIVLAKLLLIDRTRLGNLFGIASFIGYGLLCTAIGWFAPAPPRSASREETS